MPDSLAGTQIALGWSFTIVSANLLFRAHLPEAFMDDQLKPLVLPELLMDRVTEGAPGVFAMSINSQPKVSRSKLLASSSTKLVNADRYYSFDFFSC